MPTWSMEELVGWSGGVWEGHPTMPMGGVSNDTRTLDKGNLYVALKGPNFDGHSFVRDAFKRGAAAAVVRADWFHAQAGQIPGPCLCVADTLRALGELARGYRRSLRARITAVTGSAGKSTVKGMIAAILSTSFRTASSRSNWNNDVGLPLSLLAMERDAEVGVFELGMNHPGELAGLCRILEPSWGVVTNVGPVHIEFFGSVEAIAREKAVVLGSLPAEGTAVLNLDTECFDILRSLAGDEVVTISLNGGADYRCAFMDAGAGTAQVEERATGERCEFGLKVPGEHNILNALMAIAVARGHGVSWDNVRAGLAGFHPLPMRWERMEIDGAQVINDAYNANPMSMRTALKTLETLSPGTKPWLVLGGMLELGAIEEAEHRELGAQIGRGHWRGLVTVGRLAEAIAHGAAAAGFSAERMFHCPTPGEAARVLAGQVAPGDTVFMKASRGVRLETVIQAWKGMSR